MGGALGDFIHVIDFDGIMVDTFAAVLEYQHEWDDTNTGVVDLSVWDSARFLDDETATRMWDWYHDVKNLPRLSPMPHMFTTLQKIVDEGGSVMVLSDRPYTTLLGLTDYIHRFVCREATVVAIGGLWPTKQSVVAQWRELARRSRDYRPFVVIDDAPHHLDAYADMGIERVLTFPYEYNIEPRRTTRVRTIRDWSEYEQAVAEY